MDRWYYDKGSDDESFGDSDEETIVFGDYPSKHDQEYYMFHARRGRALIFNFFSFENNQYHSRFGSTKDVENLSKTLSFLDFEVEVHSDLCLNALQTVLQEVACDDHSDADCLCIVVMTHGHDHGRLAAADRAFEVSDIWSPFTADKCKSLAGKPKLFFVQACRGKKIDPGSIVDRSVNHIGQANLSVRESTHYKIPSCSDILLAFSSARGFTSIRDLDKGSWFIQCLCEELRQNGKKEHLLTILTFVCQRVAVDYQTTFGDKQMPTVVSMLTRLLYFKPNTRSKCAADTRIRRRKRHRKRSRSPIKRYKPRVRFLSD